MIAAFPGSVKISINNLRNDKIPDNLVINLTCVKL